MSKVHATGDLLTLDRGNSALKADVWRGDTIVETVVMPPSSIIRQLRCLINRHELRAAMYCSVTDDGSHIKEVFDESGIPFLLMTHRTPTSLKIEYLTPDTLGVDRIAGCAGAHSLFPDRNLLVADLGTAITYDRVSSDGRLIGGSIAPGVSLRLKALNAFTARLPKVSLEGDVPKWGYDTDTALRSGAIRGIAAELSFYHSMLPEGSIVVLTGGSAPRIEPYLDFKHSMEPHLVSIGLKACLDKYVKEKLTPIEYEVS